MYSKLAFKSVKRSLSDYMVYFLTLTIGIALFYAFNSLNEQQIMLDLSSAQKEMMATLENLLTWVSVFVSVILGFLVLFANQFLMKRRKKELGLYMTLGMSKHMISRILILETSFAALVSLVAGTLLGILLSQGMAVATSALFEVSIVSYSFIFSMTALIKTLLFFIVIFAVVMVFNTVLISRYELIDLLKASKKNEVMRLRHPLASGGLFILSLCLIIGGYLFMNHIGFGSNMMLLGVGIAAIVLGTFLFYFAGTSFILTRLQKCKRFYFKNLNLFIVRQVYSKVNTSFLSTTVISLMLFFTIAMLSNSFSYKHSLEQDLKRIAPYDASINVMHWNYETDDVDYIKTLEEHGINLDQYGTYVGIKIYRHLLDSIELFKPYAEGEIKKEMEKGTPYELAIISHSDYVKLANFQNITPVSLKENETLILSNMNTAFNTISNFISSVDTIEFNETPLNIYKDNYEMISLYTENLGRNFATFVVPDEICNTLRLREVVFNLDYTKDPEATHAELQKLFTAFLNDETYRADTYSLQGITQEMAYFDVASQTSIFIFIGIYLGLIFLICSGAVLALQLLSEASDSQDRYLSLKRIGATEKQIKKAIAAQVSLCFALPLILALSHSVFTVYYLNKHVIQSSNNLILPATFTICVFLILYGGYLLATYTGYKRIIK